MAKTHFDRLGFFFFLSKLYPNWHLFWLTVVGWLWAKKRFVSISPIPEWDGPNKMSDVLSLRCLLVVLCQGFSLSQIYLCFLCYLILFFGLLPILVFWIYYHIWHIHQWWFYCNICRGFNCNISQRVTSLPYLAESGLSTIHCWGWLTSHTSLTVVH